MCTIKTIAHSMSHLNDDSGKKTFVDETEISSNKDILVQH